MKRYLIDTTKCQQLDSSLRQIIPFKGMENSPWIEMIECEVPKDIYQAMFDYLNSKKVYTPYNINKPLGTNINNLPNGAVLIFQGDYQEGEA